MTPPSSKPPGRNDPCPCGSGRKYKVCCLPKEDAAWAVYARIRQAEAHLKERLTEFALEKWGERWFAEAVETFYTGGEPPESITDDPDFELVFLPWLAFHFAPDPHAKDAPEGLSGQTMAEYFLAHHLDELSALEEELLRAAMASPFSFYQIVSTTPGRSIDLRDILTGRTVTIAERAGSASCEPGALLYGLVVDAGGLSVQIGLGHNQIPPTYHPQIIDFRNRFLARRLITDQELERHEDDIRGFYLDLVHDLRHPVPPTLVNTDGELIAPATLEFELRCSPQRAFDRLQDLAFGHDRDDLLSDATRSADGELQSVEFPWAKKGNRKHKDWQNTILGHLTIAPRTLTAFVNSKQRADRVRKEVAKRLGAEVVFAGSRAESIDAAMRPTARGEVKGVTASPSGRIGVGEPDLDTPEVRDAIRQMQARHWEAWLDERVPALGNRTPRQAARTTLGREQLEALLESFEWQNRKTEEHQRVDVADLRRKLGL